MVYVVDDNNAQDLAVGWVIGFMREIFVLVNVSFSQKLDLKNQIYCYM